MTRTGILWWYHVNKYRAPVSCKHPLIPLFVEGENTRQRLSFPHFRYSLKKSTPETFANILRTERVGTQVAQAHYESPEQHYPT